MNYTWKWHLEEQGFTEVDWKEYTEAQLKKSSYVEMYLSPSIKHSQCGWNHCRYCVMKNQYGIEEYVALYPNEDNQGGRYINVSGNSLGAIAEAVWMSVYR